MWTTDLELLASLPKGTPVEYWLYGDMIGAGVSDVIPDKAEGWRRV